MVQTTAEVKNLDLALAGSHRIEWAAQEMPVLRLIRQRFAQEKPLQGMKLAACLHVTAETANLMTTLQAGGAGRRAVRQQPLEHAGRRGRGAGCQSQHPDLRHQR